MPLRNGIQWIRILVIPTVNQSRRIGINWTSSVFVLNYQKNSKALVQMRCPDSSLYEKKLGLMQAIPSLNSLTYSDNRSFRTATALRLGCKISRPHTCLCSVETDSFVHHALSCNKSIGRFPMHFALNKIIQRAFASLHIPSLL